MTAVKLFILYSVIPSVHVKLKSGQFPPWGSMEPYIQGRWYKFINNDGQVVDIRENPREEVVEFSKKCQAFSHWTYKRFQGKAVVCDLQGMIFCCGFKSNRTPDYIENSDCL